MGAVAIEGRPSTPHSLNSFNSSTDTNVQSYSRSPAMTMTFNRRALPSPHLRINTASEFWVCSDISETFWRLFELLELFYSKSAEWKNLGAEELTTATQNEILLRIGINLLLIQSSLLQNKKMSQSSSYVRIWRAPPFLGVHPSSSFDVDGDGFCV